MIPKPGHAVLFCLLVFLFACSSKPETDILRDREKDGLKGTVKTVLWVTQEMEFGKDDPPRLLPKLKWKQEEYNRKGDCIKRIIFSKDGLRDQTKSSSTTAHNRWGQPVETRYFDANETLQNYFLRKYDSKGRLTTERYLDQYRNLIRQWIYQRNEKENMDAVSVYKADGSLSGQSGWYYNRQGRVIRKTTLDPHDHDFEVLKAYDEQGNLIRYEQHQLKEQKQWDKYITDYDGWGKPLQRESIVWRDKQKSVSVSHFEYTFDDLGNWTEQRLTLPRLEIKSATEEKIISRIRTRTITYHED